MAKRELIDRKQAVEVVSNGFDRWHMINLLASQESIPAITEQEIVKPYLEKLKEQMKNKEREAEFMNDWVNGWNSCLYEILLAIDNLLSEQEV